MMFIACNTCDQIIAKRVDNNARGALRRAAEKLRELQALFDYGPTREAIMTERNIAHEIEITRLALDYILSKEKIESAVGDAFKNLPKTPKTWEDDACRYCGQPIRRWAKGTIGENWTHVNAKGLLTSRDCYPHGESD